MSRALPQNHQFLLNTYFRKSVGPNQHKMKILIASLLCSFISAIPAFESNSSLLESKSLPPLDKLYPSSYVVSIWQKDKEARAAYVRCSAAIYKLHALVTTLSCTDGIKEQFLKHDNLKYPQFYATIGTIDDPLANRFEIDWASSKGDCPINSIQCAVITLKKNIELPGIEEIRVGKHKSVHKRENRLFTYGFPQFANGPEYKGVPKIIDLQYMYGGFVSTTGDHDYNPLPGAPLYRGKKLLGIYFELQLCKEQKNFHPRGNVYFFQLLKVPVIKSQ